MPSSLGLANRFILPNICLLIFLACHYCTCAMHVCACAAIFSYLAIVQYQISNPLLLRDQVGFGWEAGSHLVVQ